LKEKAENIMKKAADGIPMIYDYEITTIS